MLPFYLKAQRNPLEPTFFADPPEKRFTIGIGGRCHNDPDQRSRRAILRAVAPFHFGIAEGGRCRYYRAVAMNPVIENAK